MAFLSLEGKKKDEKSEKKKKRKKAKAYGASHPSWSVRHPERWIGDDWESQEAL